MTEDPEMTCERCGGPNVASWFTNSDLWNEAVDPARSMILCPQCFTKAWETKTGLLVSWELVIDPLTLHRTEDTTNVGVSQ